MDYQTPNTIENLYSTIYDIVAYSEPQQIIDKVDDLLLNCDLPPEQMESIRSKLYDWVAYYEPKDVLEKIYQTIENIFNERKEFIHSLRGKYKDSLNSSESFMHRNQIEIDWEEGNK